MFDNDNSVDDTEQSHNEEVEETTSSNNVDLKAELEALKEQNAQLMQMFQQSVKTVSKEQETQKITSEDFKKLLETDPEKALNHALSGQYKNIEEKLTKKQQQMLLDAQVERDYPQITTDKNFQSLVKAEIRSLVEAGMPSDSPKLLLLAAKNVALATGKKTDETKHSGQKAAMSGEAPSNIKKVDAKNKPKNFDRIAAMLNMSDKAKEKALMAFEIRAQREQRRGR